MYFYTNREEKNINKKISLILLKNDIPALKSRKKNKRNKH